MFELKTDAGLSPGCWPTGNYWISAIKPARWHCLEGVTGQSVIIIRKVQRVPTDGQHGDDPAPTAAKNCWSQSGLAAVKHEMTLASMADGGNRALFVQSTVWMVRRGWVSQIPLRSLSQAASGRPEMLFSSSRSKCPRLFGIPSLVIGTPSGRLSLGRSNPT
jgi:hypothetical protein